MGKEFLSAGAKPPETAYVEGTALIYEAGLDSLLVALGLGFGGIHYVEHPNAFVPDNNYVGLYKDVARFVNRWREPRKSVTSIPWSDVANWTLDEVHNEIMVRLNDGREMRLASAGYDGAYTPEFYAFGLKARTLL